MFCKMFCNMFLIRRHLSAEAIKTITAKELLIYVSSGICTVYWKHNDSNNEYMNWFVVFFVIEAFLTKGIVIPSKLTSPNLAVGI